MARSHHILILTKAILGNWHRIFSQLFPFIDTGGKLSDGWAQLPALVPGVFSMARLLDGYLKQPEGARYSYSDGFILLGIVLQLHLLAECAVLPGWAQAAGASSIEEQLSWQQQSKAVQASLPTLVRAQVRLQF
jgi:hypothetical protein